MIGTAKEIAIEMLRDDDNDGEKFVFASWSRNDIRGLCIDWDLSDEEIDVVMERLEAELYPSVCVPLIYNIVEAMVEEKRNNRNVTIPAAALAMVMQLAGKEMERIAVCAEDGGGSAEETLKEENDVMLSLRAALDA